MSWVLLELSSWVLKSESSSQIISSLWGVSSTISIILSWNDSKLAINAGSIFQARSLNFWPRSHFFALWESKYFWSHELTGIVYFYLYMYFCFFIEDFWAVLFPALLSFLHVVFSYLPVSFLYFKESFKRVFLVGWQDHSARVKSPQQ